MTSLFKDDDSSGFERAHYSWVRARYREPEYLVYPNVAVQVIINPDAPDVKEELDAEPEPKWQGKENFFYTSSVDLCVIRRSDYLPFVAFEVDGPSHAKPRQKERDKSKDLLLKKAGIPLRRLPVSIEQQTQEERKAQLEGAIDSLRGEPERSLEVERYRQNRRSILFGNYIREYFDLLNRMFYGDSCAVFPNLALHSIFPSHETKQLTPHAPRNLCATGLVDFCVVGLPDFRPIVAFSINEDELKSKVFKHFGLPLVHFRKAEGEPSGVLHLIVPDHLT
jgi:hypothetical protein